MDLEVYLLIKDIDKQWVYLLFKNQLKGAVPWTALAALSALEVLQLHQNEALTITSKGVQTLKEALPNAQLKLPKDYG